MDAKAIAARAAPVMGVDVSVAEIQHVLDILAGCPTGATSDALLMNNCTIEALTAIAAISDQAGSPVEVLVETLRNDMRRHRFKWIGRKH